MKKYYTLKALAVATVLAFFSSQAFAQNIWFNEFHYDNAGTDVGEFIEVILQDAGNFNLEDFNITFYNGSNGEVYNSFTLGDFTAASTMGSFTLFYLDLPTNGLQNGAPDGFCLDYQGTVIQLLSYEGAFTATNGPANGMTSTDVGIVETSSTPTGHSIQLQGTAYEYTGFTGWAGPIENTKGAVNTNQELTEPPRVPLSNWAVFIGIILIGLFAFFRIRRNS